MLRSDLAGNPTFTEFLARVRDSALGAYTHQDIPFETLVAELSPSRDMSRHPLFQVMFVLQNAPDAAPVLQGVQASRLPLAGHSAKFDLTLMLRETADGLHAHWEYSTDLFDASTVERMAQHFRTLLEGVVADADQRIGELPLLTASERHRLLVEWNDTATDYPQDRCIHQLFEEQAARTPDAVAVVFEDERLSYGELDARANRLAHHLRGCGVGPEVVVGLCLERSPEMVMGLLAILKAGGAYLPLDPDYPSQRLSFMLKDAGAPVLVTHSALAARLPSPQARSVLVDADAATIAAQPTSAPALALDPHHPAYVIYTSGSTGTPKGVVVPSECGAAEERRTLSSKRAHDVDRIWRPRVRRLDLRNLGCISALAAAIGHPISGQPFTIGIPSRLRGHGAWRKQTVTACCRLTAALFPRWSTGSSRIAGVIFWPAETFCCLTCRAGGRSARWTVNSTTGYGPTEDDVQCLLRPVTALDLRRILASRWAGRFRTRGCMCWTAPWSLCLLGLLGSFTLRGRGWRGAIWGGRG